MPSQIQSQHSGRALTLVFCGVSVIGLFDSGIGGLTVLKVLMERFPRESFVYLGDTARLPYGSKSPATIEKYLWQNVRFLQSLGIKAVVVACNTASTVLLSGKTKTDIPIYNVIEPGAARACALSATGRIGVLATRATVNAQAYVRAIHTLRPHAEIVQQACPLLVPLVEEGWHDDPLTNLIIYRYLSTVILQNIDTLILGCTHYPALLEPIRKVVGPNVHLVDSASAIADLLENDMQRGSIRTSDANKGKVRLLATDVSSGFAETAKRLMHPIVIPEFESVDI